MAGVLLLIVGFRLNTEISRLYSHLGDTRRPYEFSVLGRRSCCATKEALMKLVTSLENFPQSPEILSALSNQPEWTKENPYLDILAPRFFTNSSKQDWSDLPKRVGRLFLKAEQKYSDFSFARHQAAEVVKLVNEGAFFPNSPVMMNSEHETSANLFACHVLSPPSGTNDMDTAKAIHDGCGGIGYYFSEMRDPVSATLTIERETKSLNPNRKRKAHSAVTLSYDHPDILNFIRAASQLEITHTNVEFDEQFFTDLSRDETRAVGLWETIGQSIHKTGRPSLSFKGKNCKRAGEKLINNVCGESLLRENESSLIGSINLTKFVQNGLFDFDRLQGVARLGLRLLDNLHDIQDHASPLVRERCLESRKVGVGVMGYSDALLMMNIRYGSAEALEFVDKLMSTLRSTLRNESEKLGEERGFCNLELLEDGVRPRRNASLMAIPANGTLSLIANVSGGIEPIFTYLTKQTIQGIMFQQLQPTLKQILRKNGVDMKPVLEELASGRKASELGCIESRMQDALVVANDLTTDDHILTQSKFQEFIDGGISKTINLPSEASVYDIQRAILLSNEKGCVGISLYRNESLENQPTQGVS